MRGESEALGQLAVALAAVLAALALMTLLPAWVRDWGRAAGFVAEEVRWEGDRLVARIHNLGTAPITELQVALFAPEPVVASKSVYIPPHATVEVEFDLSGAGLEPGLYEFEILGLSGAGSHVQRGTVLVAPA